MNNLPYKGDTAYLTSPYAVAAGRGRACAPGRKQRGAERGCGNFLWHEIYKNSVNSVKAGMGMEV